MTDFNNSFTMNGWDIFSWENFPGMIGSLILNFIQWLCLFVFFLESVFWVLIRGVPTGTTVRGKPVYKNLLDAVLFDGDKVFNWSSNPVTSMMILFIIIGLVLAVLMSIIAIFKSHLSTKDEDKNPKTIVLGGIKAIVLMVMFPILIYAVLKITNSLVDAVCIYNNFDTDVKSSLANKIFFMFANSKGNTTAWYDADGKPLFSFMLGESALLRQAEPGTPVWEILNSESIGFVGTNTQEIGGYDYLFAVLVLIVLMIGLFKAIMLLGKRIFDVIVLYLIAPFPIACVPNDDGKRYDAWKDTIFSKILSVFGLALAFSIYLLVVTQLNDLFSSIAAKNRWSYKTLSLSLTPDGGFNPGTILTIVYVLIMVAGGLGIPTVYTMIAEMISMSAGRIAEGDLGNVNADMAFMQRGAHALGAGALFAADKSGALNFLMGKGNQQQGKNNVSNALASTANALGNSSGGAQGGRGKLSTIGQITGANQGALGIGKKVAKGALALGAIGAAGLGLPATLALAGGIGMAQSGAKVGIKSAFGKIQNKHEMQRQNQIADKVNEALQNYGDKQKLATLNKDIKKLGGREVNDQFVVDLMHQEDNKKLANAHANKLHVDKPHPEIKTKETPKTADDKSLDGFKIPTKK